jgi:hypothetical protein
MARKMFSVAKMPPLNPFHQAVALSVTYTVFLKGTENRWGDRVGVNISTLQLKLQPQPFALFSLAESPFFNELGPEQLRSYYRDNCKLNPVSSQSP